MGITDELSSGLIKELLEYAELVRGVVKGLRDGINLLNSMRAGAAMKALAEGIKLDTKADNIRREIILKTSTEVRHGYIREWIATLVRRLDLVSESAKEAARYLTIIPYLEIPIELRDVITELSRLDMESLDTVYMGLKALLEGDLRRAISYANKAEKIEEEGDNVIVHGRKLLLGLGNRVRNPALLIMLRDFMESLESITDYAEDAADYIRTLALRIGGMSG